MNPFRPHASAATVGLAAFGLAAAVALSGCGVGQVSQTASQEPAVNGTMAAAGDVALRNIHLQAPQTSDYVRPGRDVQLVFSAINNSPDADDRLVGVTSDVGEVTLTGDTTVPANGVLFVGEADGQPTALDDLEGVIEGVGAADAAEATVTLTEPITNGLTYNFTFDFERSGQTTVGVPISAGSAPRREQALDTGEQH